MGRQSKVPKVGGGAETYPQPFVSDPKLEDPDQMGIGGSQGRDRSVYLAACRRDWFASKPYYPPVQGERRLQLRRVVPVGSACSWENPSR
jgi:hypothetical protein